MDYTFQVRTPPTVVSIECSPPTDLFRVISPFRYLASFVVDAGAAVGSHVELCGVVGPFAGLFTVQIDDGPPKTLNASRTKFSPQMVLYQGSGLGPGNHSMKISNAPFSGQTLSIDYVTVGQSP